jgi:hypothetical protein
MLGEREQRTQILGVLQLLTQHLASIEGHNENLKLELPRIGKIIGSSWAPRARPVDQTRHMHIIKAKVDNLRRDGQGQIQDLSIGRGEKEHRRWPHNNSRDVVVLE